MSEVQGKLRARDADSPPMAEGDPAPATAIGEYLKRQRVLRGITIEELAASTRIPLRSLERLEAGYFDGMTDGFVRGFVRTVSTALGLDADQTVARMLEEPVGRRWEREGGGQGRKQILAAVLLVAATALVAFGLRAGWNRLVGGGSDRSRAATVWRDPIHQLVDDVAAGRFQPTPPRPAEPVKTAEPAAAEPVVAEPAAEVDGGAAGERS